MPGPSSDIADRVQLVAATVNDASRVEHLLSPREVWRNFGYPRPPTAFRIRLMQRSGQMHAWFIGVAGREEPVGVIVLFGLLHPFARVEYAIAIADPADRTAHVASSAARALEQLLFANHACRELWAWIDVNNVSSLRLARACGWHVEDFSVASREMVDGTTQAVTVRRFREDWCRDTVCHNGTRTCPFHAREP